MRYYCYDCFTEDIELRNCQIIYLYKNEGLTFLEISQIVGLAPSTIRIYTNKYRDFEEKAFKLFTNEKKSCCNYDIKYCDKLFADTKNTNKFYLLRILNANTGNLITSKIGTTTQPINRRIYQIKKAYQKMYDCDISIEIKRVYDCRNISPICFESYFRYEYILMYPENYVENDRFEDIEFDYRKADNFYNKLIRKIENI